MNVLVGTTVLEVGIDIPHANIIIIERAERFGLTQLHQLRGRIGRARKDSEQNDNLDCHCVLLTDAYENVETEKSSTATKSNAIKRLEVLRNTTDGSKIAEADLLLRGTGEVLGRVQSGMKIGLTTDIKSHLGMVLIASKFGRSFSDTWQKRHNMSTSSDSSNMNFNEQYTYGGFWEGELIDSFYKKKPFPLSSSYMVSSADGFTLRILLCLFGQWTNGTKEGSCWLALLTLHHKAVPVVLRLPSQRTPTFAMTNHSIHPPFPSLHPLTLLRFLLLVIMIV